MDKVYEDFLKLADKKKDITDDDILVLAGADRSVNNHIKLDYLQVTSGVGVRSVASLGPVSYTHLDVYKRQGLHTCYNGGYRGPLPREWMPIPKTPLSSEMCIRDRYKCIISEILIQQLFC